MSSFKLLLAASAALVLASAGCSAPAVEGGPPDDRTDYRADAETVAPIMEVSAPGPKASAPEGAEGGECPPNGAMCASENYEAVPDVVGAGLQEACQAVGRRGYRAVVFSAEDAEGTPRNHVVEQIPEAGSNTGVDAPVYLGVPGPLPDRLPIRTACQKRDVIRNLPGNFPTSSDE